MQTRQSQKRPRRASSRAIRAGPSRARDGGVHVRERARVVHRVVHRGDRRRVRGAGDGRLHERADDVRQKRAKRTVRRRPARRRQTLAKVASGFARTRRAGRLRGSGRGPGRRSERPTDRRRGASRRDVAPRHEIRGGARESDSAARVGRGGGVRREHLRDERADGRPLRRRRRARRRTTKTKRARGEAKLRGANRARGDARRAAPFAHQRRGDPRGERDFETTRTLRRAPLPRRVARRGIRHVTDHGVGIVAVGVFSATSNRAGEVREGHRLPRAAPTRRVPRSPRAPRQRGERSVRRRTTTTRGVRRGVVGEEPEDVAVRGEIGGVAGRRGDAERHAGRRRRDNRRNRLRVVRFRFRLGLGLGGEEQTSFRIVRHIVLLIARPSRLPRLLGGGAEHDASREFGEERRLRGDGVELEEGHERRVRGGGGGPPKRPRGESEWRHVAATRKPRGTLEHVHRTKQIRRRESILGRGGRRDTGAGTRSTGAGTVTLLVDAERGGGRLRNLRRRRDDATLRRESRRDGTRLAFQKRSRVRVHQTRTGRNRNIAAVSDAVFVTERVFGVRPREETEPLQRGGAKRRARRGAHRRGCGVLRGGYRVRRVRSSVPGRRRRRRVRRGGARRAGSKRRAHRPHVLLRSSKGFRARRHRMPRGAP